MTLCSESKEGEKGYEEDPGRVGMPVVREDEEYGTAEAWEAQWGRAERAEDEPAGLPIEALGDKVAEGGFGGGEGQVGPGDLVEGEEADFE